MFARKLLGTAGVVAVTMAAVVVGPANPAHAFPFPDHTVDVSVSLHIHDEEDWPWSDEDDALQTRVDGIVVPGDTTKVGGTISHCTGDEVMVDVDIIHNIDFTGRLQTRVNLRLFEGDDCDRDDLDGSGTDHAPSLGVGMTTTVADFTVTSGEYTQAERLAMDCDFATVKVKVTDRI